MKNLCAHSIISFSSYISAENLFAIVRLFIKKDDLSSTYRSFSVKEYVCAKYILQENMSIYLKDVAKENKFTLAIYSPNYSFIKSTILSF